MQLFRVTLAGVTFTLLGHIHTLHFLFFRLKTDELIVGKAKGTSRRFGTEYSITKKGIEYLKSL